MTSLGLSSFRSAYPSPNDAIVPVALFSTNTSDWRIRLCRIPRPSGVLTLQPKLRLLRDDDTNDGDVSDNATSRMKSGYVRVSILMTSAPYSPSRRDASTPTPPHAKVEHSNASERSRPGVAAFVAATEAGLDHSPAGLGKSKPAPACSSRRGARWRNPCLMPSISKTPEAIAAVVHRRGPHQKQTCRALQNAGRSEPRPA